MMLFTRIKHTHRRFTCVYSMNESLPTPMVHCSTSQALKVELLVGPFWQL